MYKLSEAEGEFEKPTLIKKIRNFIGYDLNLKPIFIEEPSKIEIPNIERIFMNENTKSKQAVEQLLTLIKKLKDIYGDGFQMTDLFATAGLTPVMIGFLSSIKDVKEELPKLSREQIKEIAIVCGKDGMPILWTDNGIENRELGIENILALFKEITDIVEATLEALPNGIEITDAQFLPEIFTSSIIMIKVSPQAFAELKNLNATECTDLLIDLVSKVFYIIGK
jgi:hypothetical protein